MQTAKKKVAEPTPCSGQIFSDGPVVELIRDVGDLRFLISDGHTSQTTDQFEHGGVTYVVPQIHRSVRDSLVLPTNLGVSLSVRQLFNEISAWLSRASGGNEGLAKLLTFLVFATWLNEYASVAPFVWIVAPPTSDTVALKQVLRLLCRHAFLVNGLSATFLSSLPMVLQPALIADVDRPSRRLLSMLRASQTHGVYPTRGGQLVDPFCAKIVFAHEPLEDPAAAGFPIEVVLTPIGKYVPPLDIGQATQIAEEFQNKLLGYFVTNLSKMMPTSLDFGPDSGPVRALAHSLAGAIVDDNDLRLEILPYLQEFDADTQADSAATLNATIVEVLTAHCDDRELSGTDIAGYVNTLIVGRGGSRQITPETVGRKLKGLGLRTTSVSRGLKGLRMADVRPAIQKLATIYGLGDVPNP